MDPAVHNNLLVDDESFSRSRKYFWALSCLVIFQTAMEENINQVGSFRKAWEKGFSDEKEWPGAFEKMEEIEVGVNKLRLYLKRFKDHHERVSALRDGLFNASSVMESRDANKLGENVKLLTFVSVFFLPLAFCTSFWSINDDLFSITSFIRVIVIVAFSTYFVVFNLNSIVRLSRLAYTKRRSTLLAEMKDESSRYWQEKGNEFDKFSFKHKAKLSQPSEWVVSLYFMKKVPGNVWKTLNRIWAPAERTDSEADV